MTVKELKELLNHLPEDYIVELSKYVFDDIDYEEIEKEDITVDEKKKVVYFN